MNDPNPFLILFSKITTATLLLPIIVGWIQRKYLNKPLRIFLVYKVLNIFFNLLMHIFIWAVNTWKIFFVPILTKLGIGTTDFLEILFYLNDYILLGWFFYLLLEYKPYGIWVWRIAMILLISNLTNYLFIEGYDGFGVFNPTSDAIFVFGIAGFYLWHLYRSQLALPLAKNPYFWISFGLIIPHLMGLFLFLVGDVTQEENFSFFVTLSVAKNCFLILSQVFYSIGFWNARYAKYIPLGGNEDTLAQNKTED